MKISVILPMYNEEENVQRTLKEIDAVLDDDYEIIVVDDGSHDNTFKNAEEFAQVNPQVHVLKHPINRGMGSALRTGFEYATGDIIVTIDADLSYTADHIPLMINELIENDVDIIVGSPYMEGGAVEGVPFFRLLLSKTANNLIGFSMDEELSTVTGILRAYRKEVLDSLDLESTGTDINLEILSKASAIKYRIKEVPAVLRGRELGESKLRFRATTISHLLFSFYERPMILFGFIGLFMLTVGILAALFLFYEYLTGTLDPTRPLMLFMVLMIVAGIQILIFGFVATQISNLKREVYVIQKENRLIRKKLK